MGNLLFHMDKDILFPRLICHIPLATTENKPCMLKFNGITL